MNDERRPAKSAAATINLTADDSSGSGEASWWTAADRAEWNLLVDELVSGYLEHRDACPVCRHDRCPRAEAWLAHRAGCLACANGIRVETVSFGPPCSEYLGYVEHVSGCGVCSPRPCPALSKAVSIVLEWRRRRELLTLAVRLRARQDFDDWQAAA